MTSETWAGIVIIILTVSSFVGTVKMPEDFECWAFLIYFSVWGGFVLGLGWKHFVLPSLAG